MADTDPWLRRIERTALVWAAAVGLASLVWRRGAPDVALGVAGGLGLAGLSYWTITSTVTRLTASRSGDETRAPSAGGRVRQWLRILLFVFRYALLGFLAYVMIARLRLHPIGLLLGASSVVAAAAFEAARAARS